MTYNRCALFRQNTTASNALFLMRIGKALVSSNRVVQRSNPHSCHQFFAIIKTLSDLDLQPQLKF